MTAPLTEAENLREELRKVKVDLKLQRKINAALQKEQDSAQSIRETIYEMANAPITIPEWINRKHTKTVHPGIPMVMWSDWHWGENVSKVEVGGVNEYNPKIARKRLMKLVDKTIFLVDRFKEQKYPGIVVNLGGDMISGDIHEELSDTNEQYVQQTLLDLQDHLASALTRIADRFGKVHVAGVVGNHGRETKKPRHKGRVFTSYEWGLYHQLARHFSRDDRFTFQIPDEADAFYEVLGHRFLLTHGDSLGVKGGDGIIGALGPIARGTFKIGRSEAQIGRDFDTLVIGHWHIYIPRSEAVPVIVNGTMKGYDEFARLALRVPYSRPSQALWFVYEGHGIGEQWQIYLERTAKQAVHGVQLHNVAF